MFYKFSCKKIRFLFGGTFGISEGKECEDPRGRAESIEYALWMIDEMEKLDRTSLEDALKAARWIGWIYRLCNELNSLSLKEVRDLSRQDAVGGFVLPTE